MRLIKYVSVFLKISRNAKDIGINLKKTGPLSNKELYHNQKNTLFIQKSFFFLFNPAKNFHQTQWAVHTLY
jgi:hypothetical protein